MVHPELVLACNGAKTAQGPPACCSKAVGSLLLKLRGWSHLSNTVSLTPDPNTRVLIACQSISWDSAETAILSLYTSFWISKIQYLYLLLDVVSWLTLFFSQFTFHLHNILYCIAYVISDLITDSFIFFLLVGGLIAKFWKCFLYPRNII